MTGGTYRPDIDGLRAVAILSVVACHAKVPFATGGFLGVDVFFVISGFLITGLLVGEQTQTGRIDFGCFYARRVRRLVPALAIVLLASLGAGVFLFSPLGEQQALGASASAAAGFSSNIYFWRFPTGYFAFRAELTPLLHTWTLGVEEQFYIAWPLLLAGVAAIGKGRRLLAGVLLAAAAASFAGAVGIGHGRSQLAFYLTPFRGWELVGGALLALAPAKARPGAGAIMATAGLIAIVASAVLLGGPTVFPGFNGQRGPFGSEALVAIPVLGAVLVIAGGSAAPEGPASRLLGARPLTYIGKVSYGWYLWHWPLLAFARHQTPEAPSLASDLALVAAAFVLAALSYRFVETPIRAARTPGFRTVRAALLSGLAILGFCGAAGGALWAGAVHATRPGTDMALFKAAASSGPDLPRACINVQSPSRPLAPASACLGGAAAAEPTVLLWGDSHAQHLSPALFAAAEKAGLAVLHRTLAACFPGQAAGGDCGRFNAAVAAEARASSSLTTVVLAARWSSRDDWESDLARAVAGLRANGLAVVLFAEVPAFERPVPDCLMRRGWSACDVPLERTRALHADVMRKLAKIAGTDGGVRVWDPTATLCGPSTCPATDGKEVLYRDRHHLTLAGARRLEGEARAVVTP